MAIKKLVTCEDTFISAAPDAAAKVIGVMRGNKRQITLTISQELLRIVDDEADALRISRATYICMRLARTLQ
jgi:Holliday junction resolvasome RuvABC endonuclease subunit